MKFVIKGDDDFKKKVEQALKDIENALKNALENATSDCEKKKAQEALDVFNEAKSSEIEIPIVEESDGGSYYTRRFIGFGGTIHWNPFQLVLPGSPDTEGSIIVQNHWVLSHEIFHAYENRILDKWNHDVPASNPRNKNKAEENALIFENEIRKGDSKPIRPYYM